MPLNSISAVVVVRQCRRFFWTGHTPSVCLRLAAPRMPLLSLCTFGVPVGSCCFFLHANSSWGANRIPNNGLFCKEVNAYIVNPLMLLCVSITIQMVLKTPKHNTRFNKNIHHVSSNGNQGCLRNLGFTSILRTNTPVASKQPNQSKTKVHFQGKWC